MPAEPEKTLEKESKFIWLELLTRTSSFGIRSLIVAIHYVGNGFIMSTLGPTATAASSICTTLQSFTIGASSGFLVNTGYVLGEALANQDPKEVSDITKTGWSICLILGSLSSLIFLSTRYTLPLVIDEDTAEAAAEFFETFSIAAIPDFAYLDKWPNYISSREKFFYSFDGNGCISIFSVRLILFIRQFFRVWS